MLVVTLPVQAVIGGLVVFAIGAVYRIIASAVARRRGRARHADG